MTSCVPTGTHLVEQIFKSAVSPVSNRVRQRPVLIPRWRGASAGRDASDTATLETCSNLIGGRVKLHPSNPRGVSLMDRCRLPPAW